MVPITLNVSGKIATADGTQPPALKEVRDRHRQERHDRRPRCADLQSRPARSDDQRARPKRPASRRSSAPAPPTSKSLFPESKPIPIHSKLIAFNGGTKGGVTTLYIHAFLTSPVTAAVVTTVKITKEHKGPYGTRSVASVPKIAGGAGSVTAFSLTFPKKLFTYKGQKHGYLLAKCANGTFLAQAEAVFANGDQARPGTDRPRLHAEGLGESRHGAMNVGASRGSGRARVGRPAPAPTLPPAPPSTARPSLGHSGPSKWPSALLPCGAAAKGAPGFFPVSGRRQSGTRSGPGRSALSCPPGRRGRRSTRAPSGGSSRSPAPGCPASSNPATRQAEAGGS